MPTEEAIQCVKDLGTELLNVVGIPEEVKKKFESVFTKNKGYTVLCSYLANRKIGSPLTLWSKEDLKVLKNLPLASSDVERVFSIYKIMFRSNRRKFLFKNFSLFVVCKCLLQEFYGRKFIKKKKIQPQPSTSTTDIENVETSFDISLPVDEDDQNLFYLEADDLEFVENLVLGYSD